MKKIYRGLGLAILAGFLGFVRPAQAEPQALAIVASFSILGDMAQTVGGEAVKVTTLVGPDGDAHSYQPTPDDVKALAAADLVIVNGLGLEGWMQRLLESSGTKAQIITASAGVKPRILMEAGAGVVTDPHAWQDLANGQIYISNIAAALAQARPDQAANFRQRAHDYNAELAAQDKSIRDQLADIPAAQRKIITSHDAFGYFGAAYGITFLAPLGMSTEATAVAADIAKLLQQIKAEGVKSVFIENMSDPRLIAQIAKDSGAEMGGALYSDALSPPSGPAPTYRAMFNNNVPKLLAAMKRNKPGLRP